MSRSKTLTIADVFAFAFLNSAKDMPKTIATIVEEKDRDCWSGTDREREFDAMGIAPGLVYPLSIFTVFVLGLLSNIGMSMPITIVSSFALTAIVSKRILFSINWKTVLDMDLLPIAILLFQWLFFAPTFSFFGKVM